VGNPDLQRLLQMVVLHRITHWHQVALAVTEILAELQVVNIFPVAAVARAAQQVEPLAVLALTQISLERHICTAVVARDQAEIQEAHLQVAEATAVHPLQIEAVAVRSRLRVADWQVRVLLAL
jgi:hypothetical protein